MKRLARKLIFVFVWCLSVTSGGARAQQLELVVQTGHSNGVAHISISPDGNILASSDYYKIILWDIANREELHTFVGQTGINSTLFSPDGKFLASSSDESIKLWNVSSGDEEHSFQCCSESIYTLVFSPDGKKLIGGGSGYTISVWSVSTGETLQTFSYDVSSHESILSLAISPDGKLLASGSDDATVKLWDAVTGKVLKTLNGHKHWVTTIAFSHDGKLLASGSFDGNIKLWDVNTGREIKTFESNSFVNSVAFRPDGRVLAVGSKEGAIKFWDLSTGKLERNLLAHHDSVSSLAFSPTEKILFSGGYDNTIKLWNAETGKELDTLESRVLDLNDCIFSPDGRLLVATGDNFIDIWDLVNGKRLRTIRKGISYPGGITGFSQDGKLLAYVSEAITKVWDVLSGQEVRTYTSDEFANRVKTYGDVLEAVLGSNPYPHSYTRNENRISPDGKLQVIDLNNGRLVLQDRLNGQKLAELISLKENDWAVITPDGRFDASEGAQKLMHYAYGLEVINLEQLKEAYYEPGLLQKLLGYSHEPLRPIVPLTGVKLHPDIIEQKIEPNTTKLTIKLKDRGGGIGQIRVLVNNSLAVEDARNEKLKANPNVPPNEIVSLTVDLEGSKFVRGHENKVTVVTSNYLKELGRGNIQGRGAEFVWIPEGKEDSSLPTLYAIIGGVSEYAGEQLHLRFAAKDAEDFSTALQLGARRLFCAKNNPNCIDKVQITTLSSSRQKTEEQPNKENFKQAFAAVARKAKPEDILVLYLAGHGVSLGAGTDTYFYLTQEARTTNPDDLAKVLSTSTISSGELAEWLTLKQWVEGQKGIRALKQVLILDTCASGNAAYKLALSARRELSGDQIRAIEFLKDKTGTFVLMGSTADAASYEASQYGQGLLTYSLLQAMKGAALYDGEYVDIQTLFSYAQAQVPRLAQSIGGVQRPIVSAPLGRTFVIGQMTSDEKSRLDLPAPKPLLLRPLLTVSETGDDDLRLIPELRKRLDAESSYEVMRRSGRGDPILVYIDDDSFPGAVRITGTYTIEGDRVRIKAFLRRDGKTIATLPDIIAARERVIDELMISVRVELSKLVVG